ncbi:MAG: T9SS type A sorting domain-containing protein, partial [Candidatus Marinimicrobia bacterium]|nr:T9SS type A sorting domain-containing protein [Candidatus Neomarinimicrobiota bacterium]
GAFNIPTKLIVYDLLGREVTKLVNRSYLPGKYSISWDSRNSQGVPIASGIYIYRLEYGHYFKSKKMVLIK